MRQHSWIYNSQMVSLLPKKATEVFTPGAFPIHTYVNRDGHGLEESVRNAIDTPGQIVSLVGPSKSGKTVLVEHVVGRDQLITLTGAGVRSPDDVWERVLDWMSVPESVSTSVSGGMEVSSEGTGTLKTGVPFIASGEFEAKLGVAGSAQISKSSSKGRGGLIRVIKDIANSAYVVLVDDFHYMPRETQVEVAKSLKEAVRQGVRICTASVVHRGDDVVRANPELRGRVRSIDLAYWKKEELRQIAELGFRVLGANLSTQTVDQLVEESAGSPQLMQSLCLNLSFALGLSVGNVIAKDYPVDRGVEGVVLAQTAANTDFRSLVDVLDAGPRTRGTERKEYRFADGTVGDVYRVVLRSIAHDPPRLTFSYDELVARVSAICSDGGPVGSSIVSTCLHMSKLAIEKFPNERAIDWDDMKFVLDIPDPYLLFYLRWSGRLAE